ncbi:lectizyme-like [Teleopsis dalmanni]|uniref:lectizyme-like n=1 Tax=Teleopsis dalmanni TaxID=139649 RepID=UPI0018CCA642|nr:lectizyme-like [Teleopsis dalmanni]XP_037960468.1 lectizyme-like [Teleopsis dalmanni]
MKVLVFVALLVACANASVISEVVDKFVPSLATGYIIKGEDAEPHIAPYIVSLSSKSTKHSHICGGTIINKEWIITAAHCISKAEGMGAVAGLHKQNDLGDTTQAREIDFGMKHPDYTGGVGPYDIAILHVSEPFEFNEFVQHATLPNVDDIPEGETHLYGWGQPKAYVLTPAKTLQTVETSIIEWNECKEVLPENAPLHETNVCTSSKEMGISACNGDSGGPLVQETKGAPSEIIGIVSWGYIPCGVGNKPSIYTRVSAHVKWAYRIMDAFYTLH